VLWYRDGFPFSRQKFSKKRVSPVAALAAEPTAEEAADAHFHGDTHATAEAAEAATETTTDATGTDAYFYETSGEWRRTKRTRATG
jgi:hypothetical protein